MNIAISGWNGAGTSTLCYILARSLKFKLLQGSQTFRYIGSKLSYQDTGIDRIKADEYLEDDWGPLYDTYVDHCLINKDKFIIETDIAAFRIGKNPKFYSIFLTASKEERAKRLHIDSRSNDVEVLEQRDSSLTQKYRQLHNINWMDLNEISSKYNLVIDNSNKAIANELVIIYQNLVSIGLIEKDEAEKLMADSIDQEEHFWKQGKDWYKDFLKENNLLVSLDQIFSEIKSLYPERVSKLPRELRQVFEGFEEVENS